MIIYNERIHSCQIAGWVNRQAEQCSTRPLALYLIIIYTELRSYYLLDYSSLCSLYWGKSPLGSELNIPLLSDWLTVTLCRQWMQDCTFQSVSKVSILPLRKHILLWLLLQEKWRPTQSFICWRKCETSQTDRMDWTAVKIFQDQKIFQEPPVLLREGDSFRVMRGFVSPGL